jgi:chloramphenicol 3-O-phosphotransferase
VESWLALVSAWPLHLVVLRPSIGVIAQREALRRQQTGKVAYRGAFTPAVNDRHLGTIPSHLGLWLDTSTQTAEETAREIIERADEAVVRR